MAFEHSYLFVNTKKPPCGEVCLNRKSGCHAQCEKYIEWKKQHLQRKREVEQYHDNERDYNSLKIELKSRARKKKWGK